jgi:hypothetical protein
MEEDCDEVRILKSHEDIYSLTDDRQKLSYFYNSNRIISSLTPTMDFFK